MATVQQQTTQLEFHQAMADFKTMFPAMDDDVIEAVLRSNQGAVDATIDQLLAMSTDNENEKIRHELEEVDSPNRTTGTIPSLSPQQAAKQLAMAATATAVTTTSSNTSTPKIIKKCEEQNGGPAKPKESPGAAVGGCPFSVNSVALSPSASAAANSSPSVAVPAFNSTDGVTNPAAGTSGADVIGGTGVCTGSSLSDFSVNHTMPLRQQRGWAPPLLGQLPDDFLRLALSPDSPSNVPSKQSEGELEDERIALFLQNEEFMAELRWNKDFLLMLDKDSPPEERLTNFPHSRSGDEDAIFKERLRNMGKMSRKKFSQLARVFTGRKKRSSAKTILTQGPAPSRDNLLLQEEDSDGL